MVIELIADNGQYKICERFIDGVRFMKVIPKEISKMVIAQIKKTFENGEVEVTENNGWLKIEKVGTSEKLDKATEKLKEKVSSDEVIDDMFIVNKEKKMLEAGGFKVTIREI